MKTYFEAEIFVIKPKSFNHKKGVGSSCSFVLKGDAGADGQESLVWIRAVWFDGEFKEKTSYLVKGSLQVTAPYADRPAGLQVVCKIAIELNEGRYTIANKRHSTSKSNHSEQHQSTYQPQVTNQPNGYRDPVAMENPQDPYIPM